MSDNIDSNSVITVKNKKGIILIYKGKITKAGKKEITVSGSEPVKGEQ